MLNNVGYAMAVEKLLGIDKQIPERAQYIRVMVGEMSRITDHLTCLGAGAMELGAFTAFLYMLKAREWFYELLEEVSGARLTHSYVRIGGVCDDLTAGLRAAADRHPQAHARRARGRQQAARPQPHLPRPHGRHRDHQPGGRDRLGPDRPGRALGGPGVRRAQGPPVPGLRSLRLRRADRLGGRQLRPLRRAASRRSSSRCASSSRRWSSCPAARSS